MANNYILHFTILDNKCVVLQFDIRGTDYAEMYHDNFCVKTCYVRLTPDVITTGDITHYYRMRGSLIQFKYFGEFIEINYISEDSVPSSVMINNKSLNCKGIQEYYCLVKQSDGHNTDFTFFVKNKSPTYLWEFQTEPHLLPHTKSWLDTYLQKYNETYKVQAVLFGK